ncbi:MAG: (Fe-S)-binding protein, partial [Myxococcales bacterium]|nr:(Fe-S)-binding protein [Myxococcales bacterium]
MFTLMFAAFAMFAWSASRRWHLLLLGRPWSHGLEHLGVRLRGTWRYAFRQEKMDYYNPAGVAHKAIFAGFVLLLVRTLMLWGRGFYAPFDLWVLGPGQPLGETYEFVKDTVAVLVVAGTLVFFYYRLIVKPRRMALSFEGLLILAIIATMMIADMTYDGASLVLLSQRAVLCDVPVHVGSASQCAAIATITAPLAGAEWSGDWAAWPAPAGSLFALFFRSLSPGALVFLARAGFWTHATLVLLFLNLLPHSKHFHVITAIPNVFLRPLQPAGRLQPMAESAEKLMEKVGAASETADPLAHPIGVARIEHFTWKAILDFYTCTECGRCSDNCPAHRTGKVLSPKHLTLALRDHLYGREEELLAVVSHRPRSGESSGAPPSSGGGDGAAEAGPDAPGATAAATPGSPAAAAPGAEPSGDAAPRPAAMNLVPEVVHPDVLWACTSCRACEEQCPVLISYVDKITEMRRSLVMVRGEFPHELARPFQGMESNGNPWNLSRMDRKNWSDGLGVPLMSERPKAPVLFWVGCAASYDDR